MRVGPIRRGPYNMKTSAEGVLFTTFPIEGELVGTSFVVNHRWNEERPELGYFLVTNRHIVGESKTGFVTLTLVGDDDSRNPHKFEVPPEVWSLWRPHPDEEVDVCVMPLLALLRTLELPDGVKALDYKWIDTNLAPTEETVLDVGLVEEILFVGYPSGISDQSHNLPVARRGITATPATVDYEGRPVFLVDASVYPGSSGSPVFIYNTDGWTNGSGHLVAGGRVVFLGVLAAVLYREEDGTVEFGEVPTALRARLSTKQMIDLGVVFKARTVEEAIEGSLRHLGLLAPGQPMSVSPPDP